MIGAERWPWVLVGALVPVAFLVGRFSSAQSRMPQAVEQSMFRGAVLTSPFIEGQGAENADPSLVRARGVLVDYIRKRQRDDPSLRVSIYARDLNHGAWIGIADRDLFLPASLTKVAVLMQVLEVEEDQPGLLESEVVYPGPDGMVGEDTMRGAPDSLRLQPGDAYTVRDLLRRMIVYSDNHAFELLLSKGGGEGISRMLYDLSAEQYLREGRVYYDARTVAALFRALYNSSLLSRRHSELALRLLTESAFREGLRRHLPAEVVVAAKFGYHTSAEEGGPHHEFHECGIVYRPGSPYVVCVMTATDGGGGEDLQDIVGDVSRILWAA